MDLEHLDLVDLREWRRMRAWHLKQLGWKQRQIAVALGVREGTVSRWIARTRAATGQRRCCPTRPTAAPPSSDRIRCD
jgi:transposase